MFTLSLLAMLGRFVRDRNVLFALLMYLPMLPIALTAIVVDIARRGRSIPKARFSLTLLGMIALGSSLVSMIGHARAQDVPADAITLLQMNVQWGGYDSEETWGKTCETIASKNPRIIVLSEAPSDARLTRLCKRLGPEWSFVSRRNASPSRYWFSLAVVSYFPVQFESDVSLPNGAAMCARVSSPQTMRILVVDGVSNPFILRTPMLHAVIDHCRPAASAGEPVDIIAGDFNSVRDSVGFDNFTPDYALASNLSNGWRGTFPVPFPLYDLDHVWVGSTMHTTSCEFFGSSGTNHRGQVISIIPVTNRDQNLDQ